MEHNMTDGWLLRVSGFSSSVDASLWRVFAAKCQSSGTWGIQGLSFYLFISPLPSVPSMCSHRHLLWEIYKAINSSEGGGQRIRTEKRGERDKQDERGMGKGWNGQREKLLIVGIKRGAQIECKQEIVGREKKKCHPRERQTIWKPQRILNQIQRDTHGSENPISADPKGLQHKWLIPKTKQCTSLN